PPRQSTRESRRRVFAHHFGKNSDPAGSASTIPPATLSAFLLSPPRGAVQGLAGAGDFRHFRHSGKSSCGSPLWRRRHDGPDLVFLRAILAKTRSPLPAMPAVPQPSLVRARHGRPDGVGETRTERDGRALSCPYFGLFVRNKVNPE